MSQERIVPLPSPDGVKTRLSSLTTDEFKGLQSIAQDRWRQSWLRTNGWLGVFLGVLALLPVSNRSSAMTTPGLLVGLLLLGQSLWGIFRPGNGSFLRFAVVLVIAGIYNLWFVAYRNFAGSSWLSVVVALSEFLWAWGAYAIYRAYRRTESVEPQAGLAEFYDEAWSALSTDLFRNDPGSISLKIGRTVWRALLLDDAVVYAASGKKLLVIQHKADAGFKPSNPRSMRRNPVSGLIRLIALPERAVMQVDSFARYAHWKDDPVMISNLPPSARQPLPS